MSSGAAQPGFFLPVASLCWRELVRFYRQRSRVIGALGTPIVFWFLLGSGIGQSFRAPELPQVAGYLEYFFPGALLLIILFTSIFCMMSTIEDRHEGFLQSVLVAPISRAALVWGKVLGGTLLALLQGLLFVFLAPTVGMDLSLRQLFLVLFVLSLVGLAVTGLAFSVAWKLDSAQGFHSVVNLFLIPMWLLSGALFPPSGSSSWIRLLMKLNPLTYAMAALRESLYWGAATVGTRATSFGVSLAVIALFVLATMALAIRLANQPLGQKAPTI